MNAQPPVPEHVKALQRAFTLWLRDPDALPSRESLHSLMTTHEIRRLLERELSPNPLDNVVTSDD